MTFKVSNSDNINIVYNIRIRNLKYQDSVFYDNIELISSIVKQEMVVTSNDDINNPKTGDGSYLGIFLIILFSNVGLFMFLYRKEIFQL